ncbi:MAG: extracellular solute-binding protein [Chloroflexota bacterium]
MKKQFIVLVMLAAALVAGGIVAAQADIPEELSEGITITYWNEWAGSQEAGMDEIVAMFNESNEFGITVEQNKFGAGPGLSENISNAITTGELPNLVGDGFVNNAQGWFLDGVLVPLDAYVEHPVWGLTEDEAAVIDQSSLNINRPALSPFDGQLLAWPIGISSNVLSVNMGMMEELGLDGAPADFNQFREAACGASELTAPSGDPVNGFAIRPSGDELFSFILNFGGFIFDEEANAYNFTNENAIAAMEYVAQLYADGCSYVPQGGFFSNTGEFSLGLNPFAAGSSVGVPFIQAPIDEAGLDITWINTTFPATEGNSTLVTFLRGVAMFQGTPEENVATWLFIKYWATDAEAQQIWTEAAQYQPYNTATAAAVSDEFLAGNPQFASFADVLASGEVTLWSSPAHPRTRDVGNVVAELYTNITVGGMDVAEAAAAAEEAANEIYEEALEDLE